MNRKVRRKNQIPEYHAPSLVSTMEMIYNRSMKNFLTQWEY